MCVPPTSHSEKDVKSKVTAKKWLLWHSLIKIHTMTIQVNLVPQYICSLMLVKCRKGNTNLPELLLLKILPLTYHQSNFLAST